MNICVFCASSNNVGEPYVSAMAELGKCIARRGHALVFGGYDTGLMGTVAHAVADGGGKIYGVVPETVTKFANRAVFPADEVYEVPNLSARKDKMTELSHAYISGPGGFGTFDELYQVLVEEKLTSVARKPIGIYDVNGFYHVFSDATNSMFREGFLPEVDFELYTMSSDPDMLIEELERRWEAEMLRRR